MHRFMILAGVLLLASIAATTFAANDFEPCREDFDGNYTIGLSDQVTLSNCLTGPGVDNKDINCVPADFDRDHHIDLRDLANLSPKSGPCHLCAMQWAEDTFCAAGLYKGAHRVVVWDDGTGPALFVGGGFIVAGCNTIANIAKWNGHEWSQLGTGLDERVTDMTIYDDGTGPAIFVLSNSFDVGEDTAVPRIAKWDGKDWTILPGGLTSSYYSFSNGRSMVVYDDGSGPSLYVSGEFNRANNVPVTNIAKWDGSTWSAVGVGFKPVLRSDLIVFDDGEGPALYAYGRFSGDASGVFAKWDGTSWSKASSQSENGLSLTLVREFAVLDDGQERELYASGEFKDKIGRKSDNIARWTGTTWVSLGNGPGHGVLTSLDDGTGPALYAGRVDRRNGNALVSKWNNESWVPLGPERYGSAGALAVFDDGHGPAIFAVGGFRAAGDVVAQGIARWDGSSWSALGHGLTGDVLALEAFDDGNGATLYAGGLLNASGRANSDSVAKWDSPNWSPLGDGIFGSSFASSVFDDGNGAALFVGGGQFDSDWNVNGASLAKWDGSAWHPSNAALTCDACLSRFSSIEALGVFDIGTGPNLFVGGSFTSIAGLQANNIAMWDGVSWTALDTSDNKVIFALADVVTESGASLYCGGMSISADGEELSYIAEWDGASWAPLSKELDGSRVYSLASFDDGLGTALYAGGGFYELTTGIQYIARWNGSQWLPVGSRMNLEVVDMTVFDDGTGPALYAAGWFSRVGETIAWRIAKWNGSSWAPLGAGLRNEGAFALAVLDDGSGPALYVGGGFGLAGDKASVYIAKWYRPTVCEGPQ